MEMPGGAEIETGLQEAGGGKARSSCKEEAGRRGVASPLGGRGGG